MVAWFDLDRITPSPAQFNTEKLLWLNQHYLKNTPADELAAVVRGRLSVRGVDTSTGCDLVQAVSLYKDRCSTLNELADALEVFYVSVDIHPDVLAKYLDDEVRQILMDFTAVLADVPWETHAIHALIKETVSKHGLKMPKLAMPLRVMLTGQTQTPSVDAIIALLGRERTCSYLLRESPRVS